RTPNRYGDTPRSSNLIHPGIQRFFPGFPAGSKKSIPPPDAKRLLPKSFRSGERRLKTGKVKSWTLPKVPDWSVFQSRSSGSNQALLPGLEHLNVEVMRILAYPELTRS